MLARLAQWVECRIAKHNWPRWPGFKSHVRTRKIHVAPAGVSHGTKGPVVWLRCHGKLRGMNTGDSIQGESVEFQRNIRGFTENLFKILSFFLKVPLLPLVPKTLPFSGNQHSPRAPAQSQHHTTTSSKVGLLSFQFIFNTLRQNLQEYLENFKYGYRT